jgi:hypothetical protein
MNAIQIVQLCKFLYNGKQETRILIVIHNRMASHILDLLLQERPKDAYTIVNLSKCYMYAL